MGHAELVVGVQIVGRTTDVDDAVKVVLAQPDDLFLATDLAVTGPVTARSFANCQLILDDPNEITWLNTEGPLAAKFLRH